MKAAALTNASVVGGVSTIVLGAFVINKGISYGIGSASRMGPGFFPVALGVLFCISGALLIIRGALEVDPVAFRSLRPLIFVGGGIILFAMTLTRIGLGPATILLVSVSAFANPKWSPKSILVTSLGMTAFTYVVFIKILATNINLLTW